VRARAIDLRSGVNSPGKYWTLCVAFGRLLVGALAALWRAVLAAVLGVTSALWGQPVASPATPPAVAAVGRPAAALPFGDGERLTFVIRTKKFGKVGSAVMSLTGPVDIRGVETMLASFDASAGIAFLKGSDATRSWIDLARMTSLRYEKRERRPFSSANDSVEIFPDLHLWQAAHGDAGTTASSVPLDELSFIYFLRTLTLEPDSVYSFDRHYDKRRLPTTVRVVKRESIKTPVGEFSTVEYEMRVVDARDYKDHGLLYFWISEDPCRLPVRIESVMPLLGNGIMTLQTATTPNCHYAESK
jgi:hypothetical protein